MAVVKEGCVEHIVYRNSENGYTVLELLCRDEEKEITCVGSFSVISEGEYIRVEGNETRHPVYGEQLQVVSYEIKEPEDSEAVEKYLASGAVKGVGKALAARIVKAFGEDTFRVIEEEPERLADIKGISERMAREISEQFYEKRELRNSMMFLQQYGISSNLAVKIHKQYGNAMYEIIKTNPYKMTEDISGVGFKTVDEIAYRVGLGGDSEYRIRAGILYVLSQAAASGHTYLPEERLFSIAAELLKVDIESVELQADKLLIERKLCINVNEEKVKCYYSSVFYYMELNTARMLLDLNIRYGITQDVIERRLRYIENNFEIELDELQRTAVAEAARNGVFILTGGPGTGKTTTINAIIRFFEAEGMDILLAAPTGRAAKRICETTGKDARTIHRMLELKGGDDKLNERGSSDQRYSFERNEMNPLEADVIIIDEASMVDITLINALLRAISVGTRLILVGDVNQLPSVGPGNVLRDIIGSQRFNVVKLTRIFRQAAESDIVMNAHRINGGEMPVLDNKSKDFFFMPRPDADAIAGVIVTLVRDKLPKYVNAESFDIQVLTPMRKGELGVERLNTILQHYLNPPEPSKQEKEYRQIVFREGDKVMQIKNNYQIEWEVRNKKGFATDGGTGIFNGDCGVIRDINNFAEQMTIEFDEGRVVDYPFSQLDELELAYAVTIHKSQGSEYPAVVIPLLSGPAMLFNRNLLYTAVTRAKSCVTIVGSGDMVREMVNNANEQKRYSGLALQIKSLQ